MQLVVERSQRPLGSAKRLFMVSLALAEADELFVGTQEYGDVYLARVIAQINDLLTQVAFDPPAPQAVVDLLLSKQVITLSAENMDQLDEAILILTSGLGQALTYVTRARAFTGRRSYAIGLDEDQED